MKRVYVLLMLAVFTLPAYAQIMLDSSFTISGSADVYFRTNLNSSNTLIEDGYETGRTVAPGSSFANLPGFSLGMFNLIGEYSQTNMVLKLTWFSVQEVEMRFSILNLHWPLLTSCTVG